MRSWLSAGIGYLVAAAIGFAVGGAVFYVVFFFPSWFMGEDILLAWGWVGTPLGLLVGVASGVAAARRARRAMGRA
jgi:hypothetical protein